jgi:predicted acetyltransferase
MTIALRPIGAEELDAFFRANSLAFGRSPTQEEIATWRATCDFTRNLAAYDGEQIVGTAGAYTFALSVPGPAVVPAAGVSWVAVVPTHRRQGVLRSMMQHQLRDVRARGEPLAVLGASESSIYGRFGYGPATSTMSVEIERAWARLAPAAALAAAAANEHGGRIHLIAHEEALAVLPPLYQQVRGQRAGTVARDETLWRFTLRQPSAQAQACGEELGPRFYVVYCNAMGEAEGAAYYRVASRWEHALPRSVLVVEDLFAFSPAARVALWSYCLSTDLVETVRVERMAVDDSLRWLLADPRRLRVTHVVDELWVRVVDVARALAARRYAGRGRVVFEVSDDFLPDVSGRYALEAEAGPDGLATCARTEEAPDLALAVADLGAAYLGGVRFRTLVEAGRVHELTPGAVVRADALFATAFAPYCGTHF